MSYEGLKKLRKNKTDKKPTHACNHCKCIRYSPCGCNKGGQVQSEKTISN